MKLKVLGSSSSGNCYILETKQEILIIEAGMKVQEVTKAINFQLGKVVGCLVSHHHSDHAGYLKEMLRRGIWCLAISDVWAAKNIQHPRAVHVSPNKGYQLGKFKIYTFDAQHDVPCVGFVITHEECGKILFLTDSAGCKYRFKELNHIMIECNYSHKHIVDSVLKDSLNAMQRERTLKTHMELGQCKDILNTTDLSQVRNIILIHLSDNNSNEQEFVDAIKGTTGRIVHAARKGLEIEL